MPAIKISSRLDVKNNQNLNQAIGSGSGYYTPVKAYFKTREKGVKPSKTLKEAYFEEVRLFAESYLASTAGKISDIKGLAKSVPDLVVRDLSHAKIANVGVAIKEGFLPKDYKVSHDKGYIKKVLYTMDTVNRILEKINTDIIKYNKSVIKNINGNENLPLMSYLDVGYMYESTIHDGFMVETIDFKRFADRVSHKAEAAAYGADKSAFSYVIRKEAKNALSKVREGSFSSIKELGETTSGKNTRSLLFINNLYKAVIGQGWEELRSLMDQLTPGQIRDAFNLAKERLDKYDKGIEFIFMYKDDKFSTDENQYAALEDAFREIAERRNAN